jgi:WD40 repeat protein
VSHAKEVHELFASSAPDGLIKLWDVRSGSCVRSFAGHKNSQVRCSKPSHSTCTTAIPEQQ